MTTSIEERVNCLISNITYAQSLEEDFCGFIVHNEESEKLQKENIENTVKQFWTSFPQDLYEPALRCYVSCFHSQANSKRCQLLMDTLELLVECNIIPAKMICDALLGSDDLSHELSDKWCQTFKLVRHIIGGIDYKGCRDILQVMLDKSQVIPDICSMKVIDALYEVISYIIDRKTCLLPSYLAVNEISKLYSDEKNWPHWRLGQLLSDFVQTFRPTAGIVTVAGRCSLLPVVGHSSSTASVWQLNPKTLSFKLSGPLPYAKELRDPQIPLLRYVLEQPYSKDMVYNMLGLSKKHVKQRCTVLEEQFVNLMVLAMERSEDETKSNNQALWLHLSTQLIFFVLYQCTSFPNLVLGLYDKLKNRTLRKGRDHLMWVLLQFISGSIQKNCLEEFLPVIHLYDLLYPDSELLNVPDVSDNTATLRMAAICIWIHLGKKAQNEKIRLERSMPHALRRQKEFLNQCVQTGNIPMTDYRITLLCNAYSTTTDVFSMLSGILTDSIYSTTAQPSFIDLPGGVQAVAPTKPIPMAILDSLTVHVKMSLIHSIVSRVMRLTKMQSKTALAPALVETYSRLLVYKEIDSLGIKGFIGQLLPNVFSSNAWVILHTLLEMFSYRLHHIQPHYRIQLLSHLHSLSSVPQTNQNQLHLCMESTALRLIMGLGSWEVHSQLPGIFSEVKTSSLSEELNKALILALAQSLHITGYEASSSSSSWTKDAGTWWKDTLLAILRQTPHGWSSHTLVCFPTALADFYQQHPPVQEDRAALKRSVETHYRKWKGMGNENDLVTHFLAPGNPPLFLCVLWRSLLEDNHIAPTAYKVLERLGPRSLSAHLRMFSDYLVYEFSISPGGQHINKRVESLNDLIWKCNVIPVDRLVLCLSLRSLEGNEARVCFFIIRLLLLKTSDFRNRVQDFITDNSPEHWLQANWHEKHMAFHMKYPEKFYFEGLQDLGQQSQHQYLPIYFGNVCLRFLPVFDIVIHRFLELPPVAEFLETMLDNLGGLYKFHDRPVTYLYNTLHYYNHKLRDRPQLKKKLVQSIIGSQNTIRPANWCLSQSYLDYLQQPTEDTTWMPDQNYYRRLTKRLVDTIAGDSPFPSLDWRFNEFPNCAMHAVHVTCVELMALPVASQVAGGALLDIIMKGSIQTQTDDIMSWINAIGLILTSLPDGYSAVIHHRIIELLQSPALVSPPAHSQPFHMFNFSTCQQVAGESSISYLLALCHAVWHHCSIGQLSSIPQFLREQLKPLVKREHQLLFVCHLVGPSLQRFHHERTRCLFELTVELYEMLAMVDNNSSHLYYIDAICDFLYHIKYMYVGNGVKNEVERIIPMLKPSLRLRLRFISHHFMEDMTPT